MNRPGFAAGPSSPWKEQQIPPKKEYTPGFKEQAVGFVLEEIEPDESRKHACDRFAPPASHTVNASIASVVTLLESQWWRPCVGIELGNLLTAAQTEPAVQLPGLAIYMLGAMLAVLVVALACHTIAPPAKAARIAAAGVAGIVAFAVAAGRHDAIVEVLAG